VKVRDEWHSEQCCEGLNILAIDAGYQLMLAEPFRPYRLRGSHVALVLFCSPAAVPVTLMRTCTKKKLQGLLRRG